MKSALERCNIVASETIIAEVFEYLRYHTQAPHRWSQRVRSELERICRVLAVDQSTAHTVRDPKDMHVLEAAVTGNCAYIVTGDKDLLELENYQGTAILRPAEFLEIVDEK